VPAISQNVASHEFISPRESVDQRGRHDSGEDLPSRSDYLLFTALGLALFSLGLFVAKLNDSWMSWSGVLAIALMWLSCSILFGVGFSLTRVNLHSVDAQPDLED
jgi:hypothetical protein